MCSWKWQLFSSHWPLALHNRLRKNLQRLQTGKSIFDTSLEDRLGELRGCNMSLARSSPHVDIII